MSHVRDDGMYEHFMRLTEAQRRILLARITRDATMRHRVELSYIQRWIWLRARTGPNPTFNLTEAFRLSGPLDLAALDAAVTEIGQRHEVLRSRFLEVDGTPVRLVSSAPLRVEVAYWDALADNIIGDLIRQAVEQEADRYFDLGTGPLLRCRVLVIGPADHLLLINMHHLVSDGVSLRVFYRELLARYAEHTGGPAADVAQLTTDYSDYIGRQQEFASGESLATELEFWRDALAGAPTVLNLPTDRLRPPRRDALGAIIAKPVPAEIVCALDCLAKRENATLYLVLLAAYAVLLRRYSGQDDVLIGTPAVGRGPADGDLIGCFINTAVVRADLTGDPTFTEVLRRVRRMAVDMYVHSELPNDVLLDHLGIAREPNRNPLVQANFAYENKPAGLAALGAATACRIEVVERIGTRFDLRATVVEGDDGQTVIRQGYPRDLFDESTIERLVDCYLRILATVAAQPDVAVADIDLVATTKITDRPAADPRVATALGPR